MPSKITAYRVFIASPGGLQRERQLLRSVIQEYNESEALPRQLLFVAEGWEDTLGGLGRPQELINRDLRDCDYCLIMLWDRWGTPPDASQRYTSGTAEEFEVALECLSSDHFPMRDIVVLFKALDPSRLADPGKQLQAVLDFKRSLETEKRLLYTTFDELAALDVIVRKHLAKWTRDHHSRHPDQTLHRPQSKPYTSSSTLQRIEMEATSFQPSSALVREAHRLLDNGHITDAESALARAVVTGNDPEAFLAYGDFLVRLGRLAQAEVMYGQLGVLAKHHGERWAVWSNTRLGLIDNLRGERKKAEAHLRSATELAERIDDQEATAAAYTGMGHFRLTLGHQDAAEEYHQKALQIYESLGLQAEAASSLNHLGMIARERRDLTGADDFQSRSKVIHERLGNIPGLIQVHNEIGRIHLKRGALKLAREEFQQALTLAEKIGSLGDIADQCRQLGRIAKIMKFYPEAEPLFLKALQASEQAGRVMGICEALTELGLLHETTGDLAAARTRFRSALTIADQVSDDLRSGFICHRLAEVCRKQSHYGEADAFARRALRIFESCNKLDQCNAVKSCLKKITEDMGANSVTAPQKNATTT